ncbi:MAG: hypothetical protein CVU05_01730 [Bacteroidetes bacterium HGW-Bacteroidetes-21]|jgi:hypothetical protein|nr:MAG: hypothetical protein CVU05_01730 [Bacteroidetes bacterium HGW-Bacteroidetes-21]
MSFDPKIWLNNNVSGQVLVSYVGRIDSDIITDLISKIEESVTNSDLDIGKQLKIIMHVSVESLQNIYHHSPIDVENNINEKIALFSISYNNNNSTLLCGNYIHSEKIQIVKDRIEQINALNKEELKALYKLILNNQEFSEKGGGGLGLIDIARKTGTKLEFNFISLNENLYFYILKITIV